MFSCAFDVSALNLGGLLWMDEILHHFETMRRHCLLVFTGEPSLQGFLGGAGFRPSTTRGGTTAQRLDA